MNLIKSRRAVAVCFICIAVALFSTSLSLALPPGKSGALRKCTDRYIEILTQCLETKPDWDFYKCDRVARNSMVNCLKGEGFPLSGPRPGEKRAGPSGGIFQDTVRTKASPTPMPPKR